MRVTNYGGVLQSIWVPDRYGQAADVALGFRDLGDYVNDLPALAAATYFGAIVGRYANRIADHAFTLDGPTYELAGNNGPNDINTLHGGPTARTARCGRPRNASMEIAFPCA